MRANLLLVSKEMRNPTQVIGEPSAAPELVAAVNVRPALETSGSCTSDAWGHLVESAPRSCAGNCGNCASGATPTATAIFPG
jgi:hypothetical protein